MGHDSKTVVRKANQEVFNPFKPTPLVHPNRGTQLHKIPRLILRQTLQKSFTCHTQKVKQQPAGNPKHSEFSHSTLSPPSPSTKMAVP